jgi:MSHA biogenesis protein MshM
VWMRHWNLSRDPFLGQPVPYVATTAHEEAVARLVQTIESGPGRAVLRAGTGLGKSSVLARALAVTRRPARRAVAISCPADGVRLLSALAEGLGRRVPVDASRGLAWKILDESVRLCRWQRLRVVFAIDDCQHLTDPVDRLDLDRLVHLDPHPETHLTVLQAFRTLDNEAPAGRTAPWELLIRLPALTRGDAESYLVAKLAAAGRDEPAFTGRAVARLHAVSSGNPRGLDHLASLALMAGALRGLEIITPEVIDGVASECAWDQTLLTA